jgi:hypothetical protein
MTRRRIICVFTVVAVLFLVGLIAPMFLLPRSKVTRENFILLKTGMTQAEVIEIFGEEPEEWIFSGSHFGGASHKLWSGDGIATIIFERQRGLISKCWCEPGFASPTKEQFECVQIGMSLAEVKTIFGRPPESYWHSPNNVTTGRWHDIDGCGGMDFDSERVRQKWWEGGSLPQFREGKNQGFIRTFLRVLRLR